MRLISGKNDDKRRLDRILRKALPDYPLSLIHRLLRQGRILVDGARASPQDRIPSGAEIIIRGLPGNESGNSGAKNQQAAIPAVQRPLPPTQDSPLPAPQFHDLDILWQDADLLIINKPAGIAVHGPASLDTLVQRYLAARFLRPENISLSFKPGPLHRLDKPSSGATVFSLSLDGARSFSSLMREGKIQKQYLAVVEGRLTKAQTWENQLVRDKTGKKTTVQNAASKNAAYARTTAIPLAASIPPFAGKWTLILARIHTGRTHQIRAQAAACGLPLLGDKKYGGGPAPRGIGIQTDGQREGSGFCTFFLHAWKLSINDCRTVCAPLPHAFQQLLAAVFGLRGDTSSLEQLVHSARGLYNEINAV